MWTDEVLEFWFGELQPEAWFKKDPQVDATIRDRFGALHDALARESLTIPDTPRGHLAAVIVLDQFSRNLYRDSPRAFACDERALALAQRALERAYDQTLAPAERKFLYMPFMHCEDLAMQARCVQLFTALDDEESLRYAIEHRDIIERFGRFPHRNRALNRPSSDEEREFLKQHAGF